MDIIPNFYNKIKEKGNKAFIITMGVTYIFFILVIYFIFKLYRRITSSRKILANQTRPIKTPSPVRKALPVRDPSPYKRPADVKNLNFIKIKKQSPQENIRLPTKFKISKLLE